MKIKKGDFVEIDFIGKIKDTNTIFDLTEESEAKKHNLYNKNQTYKPVVICIGENEIIKGLDEELLGKEPKKSYTIELSPEKAFGKKNSKLIKLIPANAFKKQKITPFPGLQLNMDGIIGTVRAVSGGRIIVDFNHPLAGKNLIYEVKINKIITEDKEKIKSIIKSDEFELKNNELTIKQEPQVKIQEAIKKQIKKHIKSIKKTTFSKSTTKNN